MTGEKKQLVKVSQEIDELEQWAKWAMENRILPTNSKGTVTVSPGQVKVIVQTGKELGISPVQSLRRMAYINGKLVMDVQLQLAIARQRGVKIKSMQSNSKECIVTLERDGEEITCEYTIEDAKNAGLLAPPLKCDGKKEYEGRTYPCKCVNDPDYHKPGWQKYPKQYLRWRTIGDALRLLASDLLLGLLSPEEAENIDEIPATPLNGKPVVKMPEELPPPSPEVQAETPPEKPAEETKFITAKQVKDIRTLLKKKGIDEGELLVQFKTRMVAEVPVTSLEAVVKWITDWKV